MRWRFDAGNVCLLLFLGGLLLIPTALLLAPPITGYNRRLPDYVSVDTDTGVQRVGSVTWQRYSVAESMIVAGLVLAATGVVGSVLSGMAGRRPEKRFVAWRLQGWLGATLLIMIVLVVVRGIVLLIW